MSRGILIGALAALALAAPAQAQRSTLMPGVTYERGVQFTAHGPVAFHVVLGPRPTGLYALRPVLSNETIVGRETVSQMQKRLGSTATMVGTNADMFAWANGRPSGMFMRDRVVASPPSGDRSSVGVRDDGTLDVRRVEFFGTWRGLGQRRSLNDVNQAPGPNGIALFTGQYAATTPFIANAATAVLDVLPPPTPNTDLVGTVMRVSGGAATPIPPGGAVLVARGTAAERLREEAPVGTPVTLRLIFRPEWNEIASAVGGGPQLVRNGGPVFRANEAFTPEQLLPRNPRTAIGQRADGRIVMVVADGRQAGYSVGMTNFELAQTLVRLGAVTAMALDAGGSSTLAFEGTLLNRPSDRSERPIATALMLMYYGVTAALPATPVVSPNGDGVAERQRLSYKVVLPSTVTATLTAPDGTVAWSEQGIAKTPGTYAVPFPPVVTPPPPPAQSRRQEQAPAEGRWKLDLVSVDEQGRSTTASQTFTVNNTLGALKLATSRLTVRPGVKTTRRIRAGVTLTRPATVLVTVETRAGVVAERVLRRRVQPGRLLFAWDGRTFGGRQLAYGGSYVLRVRATNELGSVELTKDLRVTRLAPLPKKKPAAKRS